MMPTLLHDVSAGGVTFCQVRAAVARHPDVAVVGAGPNEIGAQRRRSDRVDDAVARDAVVVGERRRVEIRRRAFVCAREIGADDLPRLAAVARAKDVLVSEVERRAVDRRERERQRPRVAPDRSGMRDDRIDVLLPAGRRNLSRHRWAALAARIAVDEPGRLGSGASVPFSPPTSIGRKSCCEIVPYLLVLGGDRRARVLLRAVDPVRKRVVGDDVIELRRRLVVPRAPRLARRRR